MEYLVGSCKWDDGYTLLEYIQWVTNETICSEGVSTVALQTYHAIASRVRQSRARP